ncbi:uncharacterized protein [Antedon mediterranea]|uniref:uncharacterized protein n=1 Tax=Antedon mediterranea TaxID=105859 RepID=UPI003AF5E2B8
MNIFLNIFMAHRNRSTSDSFINSGHLIRSHDHVSNKVKSRNRSKKETPKSQAKSVPVTRMSLDEDELNYQVSSIKDELNDITIKKKIALGELKILLDSVHQNKSEIKKANEVVRQHQEKAETARSELMVLEFQRDQAQRELRDVEEETAAKGRTLQELDRRSSQNSREDVMMLGLSKSEIISVVQERDELKERLCKNDAVTSDLEKNELARQLNLAKQDLFSEQKTSREKMEKLTEELEEQLHKIEELEYTHEEKVREYEEKVNDLEDKAMKQLAEKNALIENMEKTHKQEKKQMEKGYTEKEQKIDALNKTIKDKQEVYDALRDKLYALQEDLSKSQENGKQILQEKERVEKYNEINKETALLKMRDNLLKEKESELGKLRQEMVATRQDIVRNQEETFKQQTNKYEEDLKEKVEEIDLLKSRLQEQEKATRGLGEKLRKEALDQIKNAIKKEREIWEDESKKSLKRELIKKNDEERWATTQLKADIAKEKQYSSQLQIAINSLKDELDSLRQENLTMHRQKVEAVSKIREEARQERQTDLEEMRQEFNQEKTKELQKLKESERAKDEEIKILKSEIQKNKEREREVLRDYERTSRSLVMEMNEECKKTSQALGVSSKKVLIGAHKGAMTNGKTSSSGSDTEISSKVQLMSALGNIKGCNEDLRNKLQELKQSLDKQKRINLKASKVREKEKKNRSLESSSSLQAMKDRLDMDHTDEIESLQQTVAKLKATESALQGRLVEKDKEMIQVQKGMTLWKEETALKMAKKFEEELNKELQVRMQDSHHTPLRRSANSDRSASPSPQDANTVKLLRHLQEKIKLLRHENVTLKRDLNSSHLLVDELETVSKLEDKEQQRNELRQKDLLKKHHSVPKHSHSYGKLP